MQTFITSSIAVLFLATAPVYAAPTSLATRDDACPVWTEPTYGDYEYMGCMTEATDSRTLNLASTTSDAMTIEVCAAFCSSKGLPLMGVEYGRECYCGTYPMGTAAAAPETDCDSWCSGDPFELCGGGRRLNMYGFANYTPPAIPTIAGYTYQGCYVDAYAGNVRALGSASYADYTGMTVQTCQAFCSGKGYSMFGLEYAGECWCANSINSTGGNVLATGGDSECTSTCPGDYTQLACGASSRLSVYKKN